MTDHRAAAEQWLKDATEPTESNGYTQPVEPGDGMAAVLACGSEKRVEHDEWCEIGRMA